MSFILDALKKSENERQRQIGPSLADMPMRRTREDRPWWAFAVAALLLVNLIVLLVVLLRDKPAPAAPASTTVPQAQPISPPSTQPSVPSPSMTAQPAPVRSNPAVQSLADAAGSDADAMSEEIPYDPSIASAAMVPEGPPVVRSINGPMVAPSANQPAFAARDRDGAGSSQDSMLPTHGGLLASGTRLPDMRLDIHVFSPAPRDRFIFVNMRKYVEGQTITEGPMLERITPDGAIFNSNGTRFLLPRQ